VEVELNLPATTKSANDLDRCSEKYRNGIERARDRSEELRRTRQVEFLDQFLGACKALIVTLDHQSFLRQLDRHSGDIGSNKKKKDKNSTNRFRHLDQTALPH
jgi:hypothetical protein